MKTAAIYARVSTADQVKGTSLDGQVQLCQDFAKEHGYTVIKVLQEDASGARLDRPKLGELRDMAARHEIEALIVFANGNSVQKTPVKHWNDTQAPMFRARTATLCP